MPSPAEIIQERRAAIMQKETGFEWILGKDNKCEHCGAELDMTALMSVEICLNSAHFGDLASCILCPHCDSMYYLHARKYMLKEPPFFDSAEVQLVNRDELIRRGVNNTLEMSDEELKELADFTF